MNIIALCTLLTAHFTITVKAFTLQTTFNNDAGTAGGNMFDVQNVGSWPVHIESFDVNIWKPPSQPDMTVTIYTKSNSYKTFETNSNAWTLIHTQIYTSPRNAGSVTKLGSLSTPLIINTGSIQALFIHCTGTIWSTDGQSSPGFSYSSDSNLVIYEGIVVRGIFTGTIYDSPAAIWNGNIHYSTPDAPTKPPTNMPTVTPSLNPTISPTTNQPTTTPTVYPTNNPTNIPTIDPTTDPTVDPTVDPTADPTVMPSILPTIEPTTLPTTNPTKPPTIKPTNKPISEGQVIDSTMQTLEQTMNNAFTVEASDDTSITYMHMGTLGLAVILVLILIISYFYACYEKNDFYDKIAFIMFISQLLDTLYDIIFCLELKNAKFYSLMISSVIFIIFPIIMSYMQLLNQIKNKWMKVGKNELRQWLTRYVFVLYFLSIIAGSSFTAIKLCQSNLFGLKIFDIPLTKGEIIEFQTKRVFSIILFENVPQLSLQCIYLFISQTDNINNVVFITMGFSLISIIIAVTSSIQQKAIIKSQDRVEISFDVSNMDVNEIKYAQNCVNKLKQRISGKLGVDCDLFEIPKPTLLPNNSLNVTIMIHINQKMAVNNNYETLINNANHIGEIARLVKESWNLSKNPTISNLSYQQIMSQNTIHLKATTDVAGENIVSDKQKSIAMSILNSKLQHQLPNAPLVVPVTSGQDTDESESNENHEIIQVTPINFQE
eukprot:195666_1